jgi:spore germination protein
MHIVQAGESLWGIAQKYGQSLEAVVAVNHITNPDMIYPGQSLIIPT